MKVNHKTIKLLWYSARDYSFASQVGTKDQRYPEKPKKEIGFIQYFIGFLISFLRLLFFITVVFPKIAINARSQLGQDIFALLVAGFKKDGYFVEFGATNGIKLSNTYLLEKEFRWSGILSEPANCWKNDLLNNRKAVVEFDCVWSETGKVLEFIETTDHELSTLSQFSEVDVHSNKRVTGISYEVMTVSLGDLLTRNNAPKFIDYLSIDTEGSEFEILSSFDFQEFSFGCISCEHNFGINRDKVFNLLTSKGYKRVFQDLSLFDDWYVLDSA